jgi:ribosomal subunit interface protein
MTELPLQISFHGIAPTDAIEARVAERAAKLDQFFDRIMSCRVVVGASHRRPHKGKIYSVRIDVTVPREELVVNREPSLDHSHEDIFVAIRDAFDAADRQLEDYARRQRGQVKTHEGPDHGRVCRLFPEEGYGFIERPDGRELYFHRNSVLDDAFKHLRVNNEVRFVMALDEGEKGPHASTVQLIGKHHASLASRRHG